MVTWKVKEVLQMKVVTTNEDKKEYFLCSTSVIVLRVNMCDAILSAVMEEKGHPKTRYGS